MGHVRYETADGVASITMDDGKANALTFEMLAGLRDGFERAEADGVPVVLAGRDGRFSGGFDLATLLSGGDASLRLLREGFELAHRMLGFPRPVVVACTGHAYAMGAFLVLCGDLRLGVQDADHRITANEVAIGLTMPHAAIAVCRQRLTPAAFERAVLLAEVFDPETAVDAGFLDVLVPPDQLLAAAGARAAGLLALDPAAFAATKA
ncbi:MAG TPA: crotonase/enoyl-CoA hydratase family protein, partial [Acidimicrobiales bacterium]|nr:crotonase/enoyl-CoA hydratase family protein [Acidimicrobiales bacterium]